MKTTIHARNPLTASRNALTKEQLEFLQSLLRETVSRIERYPDNATLFRRAPKSVRAAKRRVDAFLKKERSVYKKRSNWIDRDATKIKSQILFGDPRVALKMIETLGKKVRS